MLSTDLFAEPGGLLKEGSRTDSAPFSYSIARSPAETSFEIVAVEVGILVAVAFYQSIHRLHGASLDPNHLFRILPQSIFLRLVVRMSCVPRFTHLS